MPYWVTDIIEINQTGLYLANEAKICNVSEFDDSLYKVNCQYTINCFANISIEETCMYLQTRSRSMVHTHTKRQM